MQPTTQGACEEYVSALSSRAMLFHVTMEKAEDGWFVTECPALPGCVSQGTTENEALANIKEAIVAWLWAEDQKALEQIRHSGAESIVVSF